MTNPKQEIEEQIRKAVKTVQDANGDEPVYVITQKDHDQNFNQVIIKELENIPAGRQYGKDYQDSLEIVEEYINNRIQELEGSK